MDITKVLFKKSDRGYRDFHSKLLPTVDKSTIIGVRVPALKAIAKDLYREGDYESFTKVLPHKYYEQNNLHAFLICNIKDYDKCIAALESFLPYIDNWATCDSLRPACFAKNRNKLINNIDVWLNSAHTYTVRFGTGMLLTHYLDEDFDKAYLQKVADLKSDEYYVNMMSAWYFATALAKQWDSTIAFIEKNMLSDFVHNKTISKAIESFRITGVQKEYLRNLKRRI